MLDATGSVILKKYIVAYPKAKGMGVGIVNKLGDELEIEVTCFSSLENKKLKSSSCVVLGSRASSGFGLAKRKGLDQAYSLPCLVPVVKDFDRHIKQLEELKELALTDSAQAINLKSHLERFESAFGIFKEVTQ